jgi:hypothetical protein
MVPHRPAQPEDLPNNPDDTICHALPACIPVLPGCWANLNHCNPETIAHHEDKGKVSAYGAKSPEYHRMVQYV